MDEIERPLTVVIKGKTIDDILGQHLESYGISAAHFHYIRGKIEGMNKEIQDGLSFLIRSVFIAAVRYAKENPDDVILETGDSSVSEDSPKKNDVDVMDAMFG